MWFKKKVSRGTPPGPALSCMRTGHCSQGLCPMWVKLYPTIIVDGKPQTVKEEKCTFAWMPTMMIELRDQVTLAGRTKGNGGTELDRAPVTP